LALASQHFPAEQSGMVQGMAVSFSKGSMDKVAQDVVPSKHAE